MSAMCLEKQAGQAHALQSDAVPPVLDFNFFGTAAPSTRGANSMKTAAEAASARRPAPRGTKAGVYIHSAFVKLAKLEAKEASNAVASTTFRAPS